jgi:hypothetical protein
VRIDVRSADDRRRLRGQAPGADGALRSQRFSHEIRSLDVDDLERSLEALLAEGDRLSPQLLDLAAVERQVLVDRLSTVDDLISSSRGRG